MIDLPSLLRIPVSVPLPGFSGLRQEQDRQEEKEEKFQSRCRDSVG